MHGVWVGGERERERERQREGDREIVVLYCLLSCLSCSVCVFGGRGTAGGGGGEVTEE